MYVRFITQFINEDGEPEAGIFQAAGYIRSHSFTHDDDVAKLKLLNGWFNTYLEKPNRFSNATNKSPASISLSWYKDSAKQHLF